MLGVRILRSASDAQMLACANTVHLQTVLGLTSEFLARYAVVLHLCSAMRDIDVYMLCIT